MLRANVIMYSRSLSKDYRWIYGENFLNENDKKFFIDNYAHFENNKDEFLNNEYLIVQRIQKGVVIYRFLETKDLDQNSRKIYALIGCACTDFDMEIVKNFGSFVFSYMYFEWNVLFEKYLSNIPDSRDKFTETVEFSLDTVAEYFRTDSYKKNFVVIISGLLKQQQTSSFIIKNFNVTFIPEQCVDTPMNEKKSDIISQDKEDIKNSSDIEKNTSGIKKKIVSLLFPSAR